MGGVEPQFTEGRLHRRGVPDADRKPGQIVAKVSVDMLAHQRRLNVGGVRLHRFKSDPRRAVARQPDDDRIVAHPAVPFDQQNDDGRSNKP